MVSPSFSARSAHGWCVGRVILPEHKPLVVTYSGESFTQSVNPFTTMSGATRSTPWSQSLYDALRIATWAVLIVGLLMVIVGLISYARSSRPRGQQPFGL